MVEADSQESHHSTLRAQLYRRLLEAESFLQSGEEQPEEAFIPLAMPLLRGILGSGTAIVCYTFTEGPSGEDGSQTLYPRWRYSFEPDDDESLVSVATVPLLLDGEITSRTARSRAARCLRQSDTTDALPGFGDEVRGGPEARARFSVLTVPILSGDHLFGVINAYRPAALPFDDDELDVTASFSRIVAAQLRRSRLQVDVAAAEARASDLFDQSPDPIILHTVDGRIVQANNATCELVGFPAAKIIGRELIDFLPKEEHDFCRQHLEQSLINSPQISREFLFRRADGGVGTMQARTWTMRRTDENGLPLLQTIAHDVTDKERQRRALEVKVRELDMLIGVGESLNSSLQLETVLHNTLRTLMSVVACPTALICLYEEAQQRLLPVGIQGWPADEDPARPIPATAQLLGAILRGGQPAFLPDLRVTQGILALRRETSPGAALIVPVMRGADPLGCFLLLRPRGEGFADDEQRLAAAVARQTAIAIENARLFGRVRRQLSQIKELQDVTADLVSDLDLEKTLDRICHTLTLLVGADKAAVRFLSRTDDTLQLVAHRGFSPDLASALASVPASSCDVAEALRTLECIVTPDLRRIPAHADHGFLIAEGIIASCAVPIVGKERVPLGILQATWAAPHHPAAGEVELVRTYANYAAAAIENGRLYRRTRELYLAGIQSLAATLDARDTYTHRHSRNVAFYAREMACELQLPQEEIETIELAALLHDIGKIGIADAILGKPGKLSPDEMSMMIGHATQGANILAVNAALSPLVPLVKYHHEWYNGSGYPEGLAREALPIGAAIISVADAFDTMTTDRAYRRARSLNVARGELLRGAGQQFNPRVVEAFFRVLDRDERLNAPYIQTLRSRGTSALTTAALTLAEGARQQFDPDGGVESGAGQIQPQQLKELRALHHLAKTVSAITDLALFLDSVVDLIKRELGYTDCAILLLDEGSGDFVAQAISGFDATCRGRRQSAEEGMLGIALLQRKVQNVPSVASEPLFNAWMPASRSALIAPLFDGSKPIGAIVIESAHESAFSADDEMTLEIIATQLTTGIAVARLHDQEKRAAITDGLTGVYNHRYFYQRLEHELAVVEQRELPLAVIVLDVNGLKALNDTHGHPAGDTALRTIAGFLRDGTGMNDTVARYGGDEFAVILPGALYDDAAKLLAELRGRLYSTRGLSVGTQLTVSAGVACYPNDGPRATSLVAIADERMYAQKRGDRRSVNRAFANSKLG